MTNENEPAAPSWRRIASVITIIAVIAIVVAVGSANWDSYRELLRNARPLPLAGALLAGLAGHMLNTLIAHDSLRLEGAPLPFQAVYRVNSVAGLAKFLPGGVWQIGSQYGVGRTEGLGFRHSMLAWLEPTAFNVTIGSGLALLAATQVDYGIPAALLVIGSAVALLASTNPIRYRLYRMIRVMPRDQAIPAAFVGWPLRAGLTALVIAASGLGGLWVIAAFGLESPGFVGSVAAFVGAWVVGVLVFPIPGGLGVREGALVLALSPWMSAADALLVAAAARLVGLAAELLAALVSVAIRPTGADIGGQTPT